MKIRPKKILLFQNGGEFDLLKWIDSNPEYFKWYSGIYPNAQKLMGDPLKQRNNYWNKSQLSSSHYTTDDLKRSAYNNYLYTNDYNARLEDISKWAEAQKDLNELSAQQIVDRYNKLAGTIRQARETPQTYNTGGYSGTNRTFRTMFYNRSRLGTNTPLYTIGYLDNLDDIEGTSTWQRRMDRYLSIFENDSEEGKRNRTFYITKPNGEKIKIYKKENGDIGLFPNNEESINGGELPEVVVVGTDRRKKPASLTENPKLDKESFLDKLGAGFKNVAPDLLEALRLAGNLHNNERVYDAVLKGIRPTLLQSYNTHRLVVGDEATKLAYYRRASQGLTKAALPFTSDADRQMAYQYEAKRIGDELRAQGDIADNLEIRRTSDESNQHLWGNTQRATEVANYNIGQINQAFATKLLLKAQKYSADWTNLDNYLTGLQSKYELKKNRQEAIKDLINTLTMQDELASNERIREARENLEKVLKETNNNYNDPRVKDAADLFRKIKNLEYIKLLRIYYGKSGTKLEYKANDKYLYKVTRDTVEHFRRMSKMADDSRIKSKDKPIKLSSHPKGNTRRYLYGGIAPFTIFRPLGMGGEKTVSTQTDGSGSRGSSNSKDNTQKEKLDMIKELFKSIKGLPNDVNLVYKEITGFLDKAKLFGEELSTDDIASMYLNSMLRLASLLYSLKTYDDAVQKVTANEGLEEFAITDDGKLVLLDINTGKILFGTLKDIENNKNLNPLKNNLLLKIRATSMGQVFNDSLLNIVDNGIGMNKIAALIKNLAGNIGTSESKIEGISQVESNNIKAGLLILAGAPDGYYKITRDNKTLQKLVDAALAYIYNMLPNNYRTLLNLHSGGHAKEMISTFLTSLLDSYESIEISPLTGKASDKDEKDSSEKIKSSPLMLLILGEGGVPRTWNLITKDSNVKMSVDGIEYSQLPKITEDMSLDKMLSESGIAGILDSKLGITFGDLNISPDLFKDIMYSNSGGMVVTLPCKIVNGHKEVNLGVKKTYEEAIQEVESKGLSKNSPEYYKILGEVLKQKGLNSLLDSNGYPDRNKFGQFLVVEAYTTDKIKNLDTSSQYIEKVKNPDALLEERMIKALSTDSKKSNYNLDIDYWLYGDDVYRGTVFIPLNNNLNAAINASGNLISVENARKLENKFQNFNKASNMKSSNSDVL